MSEKIKVGLVGIGRAAWGMQCPELAERSDLFELVATCDVLTERNKTAQDKYGAHIKGYDNIESLVEDPNVELVSVATPSTLHISHAKTALKAGKHVFLEKPMTINY
jgi:predicted dehydrogenase